MTYKKGDKVRVKSNFWELPNPTGLEIDDSRKRALAGKLGEITHVDGDGDSIIDGWSFHPSWIELAHREIEDVREDDLITDGEWFRRVLGRCGKVVHLSCYWKKEEQETTFYGFVCSVQGLKKNNYSIVQDTPTEDIIELTLEDVAKLKGIDVKKLRIKD